MFFFAACSYTFFWLLFNSIRATKGACVGQCDSSFTASGIECTSGSAGTCYGCFNSIPGECSNVNTIFEAPPKPDLTLNLRTITPLYCGSDEENSKAYEKCVVDLCEPLVAPRLDLYFYNGQTESFWEIPIDCFYQNVFDKEARRIVLKDVDPSDALGVAFEAESKCIDEINTCKGVQPFVTPLSIGFMGLSLLLSMMLTFVLCRNKPASVEEALPVAAKPEIDL